jgi:hypothetical protein
MKYAQTRPIQLAKAEGRRDPSFRSAKVLEDNTLIAKQLQILRAFSIVMGLLHHSPET